MITPSIWKVWVGSFNLCAIVWSLGHGYNRWPEIIYENYHHCAGVTWPMCIYYLIWSFFPYACSYVSLYTIWQYFHPSCVGCKHVDVSVCIWEYDGTTNTLSICHEMKTILWYHLCSESLRYLTTTIKVVEVVQVLVESVFFHEDNGTGKSDLEDLSAFCSKLFPSIHQCWKTDLNSKEFFWRLVKYGVHTLLVIR